MIHLIPFAAPCDHFEVPHSKKEVKLLIPGPPCIFAPYIFCPADCNLNFPALFGLAAVITNPCGCVN